MLHNGQQPGRHFLLGMFYCLRSWFSWVSFGVCTMASVAECCFKPCLKWSACAPRKSKIWELFVTSVSAVKSPSPLHQRRVPRYLKWVFLSFVLPAFSVLTKHICLILLWTCHELLNIPRGAHFGFNGLSRQSKLRLILYNMHYSRRTTKRG